jgi:serine/threonine-protein phosphatase 2A regulatory subunit B''
MLTQGEDHTNDIDLLIYAILKKPDADTITPNDFLPILEDIVLNHPSLQFLEDNMAFQERYSM